MSKERLVLWGAGAFWAAFAVWLAWLRSQWQRQQAELQQASEDDHASLPLIEPPGSMTPAIPIVWRRDTLERPNVHAFEGSNE